MPDNYVFLLRSARNFTENFRSILPFQPLGNGLRFFPACGRAISLSILVCILLEIVRL